MAAAKVIQIYIHNYLQSTWLVIVYCHSYTITVTNHCHDSLLGNVYESLTEQKREKLFYQTEMQWCDKCLVFLLRTHTPHDYDLLLTLT